MDIVVSVINSIFEQIGKAGQAIINALPPSPLRWSASVDSQILRWLNWIIPVGEMVVIAEGWLLCIAIWYVVRVVMRWLKGAAG